jgi:diguanylate cyclase (GGDEF)-like protein
MAIFLSFNTNRGVNRYVFYNYAHLILMIPGILIGLTGYCVDTTCRIDYKVLLWLGITFILAMWGFITGSLIRKLNIRSHTDFLTGLYNRRYFHLKLAKEARTIGKKTSLCIAMIDVDNFKAVNDTYGHSMGDLIISDLAAVLKKNTRSTDIVTRWGGDEFAIIFSETSFTDAYEITERIRRKIETKFHSSYGLTISAGINTLEPNLDLKDLLVKADQALYKAKAQKNSVVTSLS